MIIQPGTQLNDSTYNVGIFLRETQCCEVYLGCENQAGLAVTIYRISDRFNDIAPELLSKLGALRGVKAAFMDMGNIFCVSALKEGVPPEKFAREKIDPLCMGDTSISHKRRNRTIILLAVFALAIGVYYGYTSLIQGNSSASFSTADIPSLPESRVTDREITIDTVKFTYSGPLSPDGLPQGTGTARYTNDLWKSYSGEWKDGKWHGNGTLEYAGGDIYKGAFRNGAFTKGRYTVLPSDPAQGDYYTGTFRNGKPYNGKWCHRNGSVFQTIVKGK